MNPMDFSRRDFIKLGGMFLLGAAMSMIVGAKKTEVALIRIFALPVAIACS